MKITVQNQVYEYEKPVRLSELAEVSGASAEDQLAPLAAEVNGKLAELWKPVTSDADVRFVTLRDIDGKRIYERGMIFLLVKAIRDLYSREEISRVCSDCAIGNGIFCSIYGSLPIDDKVAAKIKKRMKKLVEKDIRFEKHSVTTEEAIRIFHEQGMEDKVQLFHYRLVSNTNLYKLGKTYDYYYGYMPPSTGSLANFDLFAYDGGLILVLPERGKEKEPVQFNLRKKLLQVMRESNAWEAMLGLSNVADLNDVIVQGGLPDLVLMNEALQEQRIAEIAKRIAEDPDKKLILIAGPSSSGKTSFSHRLSTELRIHGLTPHPVAVDDYFKNREDTPKDENGEYDFESISAIDIEQFNDDMLKLLAGEEVELPTFNFKTGHREYKGNKLKIGKNDVLVLEGIHGLNDEMTYKLPEEIRFRIYVSALILLNVDDHNRIPTTDARLLRRMVRDARTRGISAEETLARWPSVRRGEEKNIFPFQERADAFFNSSLTYELAVIKPHAERLLYGISKDSPYYSEAKRLLKFLDYCIGISPDVIPSNSLIREFTGGSYFPV